MAGPNLPVNIDSTYANSSTDPSINAHQKAHDTLHRIVNTLDTRLGTATVGQVLTWNGAAYAPGAKLTGVKAIEDASRSLYALSPSVESGLAAVAADGSTDDAPRLSAMLQYLKKTYGGGRLHLPPGRTSNCNSTITIPAGVQVVGSATSVWDFWHAGTAITAVVVQDKDFTPITGLRINGIQWEANLASHNTTTSTGLKITGYGLNFEDLHVRGFNWGVDLTANDTYLATFERSTIANCMVGVNLDLDNSWSNRAGRSSNSGERIAFTDCVVANCDTVYWATGHGAGLFFTHTSMDFCVTWGRQQEAHVFFNGCHLETSYGGRNRHLFDLGVNTRLYFTNSLFIVGAEGVYHAINPTSSPWNLGWGMANFTSCNASFTPTPAAQRAGAVTTNFSEALVAVPPGTTQVVIASFFVSKWNPVKVAVVAADGPAADVSARLTAVDVPAGTVTVTLSKALTTGAWLEVSF